MRAQRFFLLARLRKLGSRPSQAQSRLTLVGKMTDKFYLSLEIAKQVIFFLLEIKTVAIWWFIQIQRHFLCTALNPSSSYSAFDTMCALVPGASPRMVAPSQEEISGLLEVSIFTGALSGELFVSSKSSLSSNPSNSATPPLMRMLLYICRRMDMSTFFMQVERTSWIPSSFLPSTAGLNIASGHLNLSSPRVMLSPSGRSNDFS